MDKLDYLNDALKSNVDVYLASSVFIEMTIPTPSITLWEYDNVLNITSTKDFNSHLYYNKNAIKICDVYDIDTIIDIYNATYGFEPNDVKINRLIGIFSRLSVAK